MKITIWGENFTTWDDLLYLITILGQSFTVTYSITRLWIIPLIIQVLIILFEGLAAKYLRKSLKARGYLK